MSARPRPARPAHIHTEHPDGLYAAVARLSIQDINELAARQAQMYRTVGTSSSINRDRELALQLARQEAEMLEDFNTDRVVASSLQEDVVGWNATPVRVVNVQRPIARQVINNTPLAINNTRLVYPRTPTGINVINRIDTDRGSQGANLLGSAIAAISSWWYGSTKLSDESPSTTPTSTPSTSTRLTGHNCVICQDPIRGIEIRAPCGHFYDKNCVLDLFQSATRDESLYPPRCCQQNIPVAPVEALMTADARLSFQGKAKEFGTLKRVYCANPTCSRFLCAQSESVIFSWRTSVRCTAPRCITLTCTRCKTRIDSARHQCKMDTKDQEVLALGERAQWARCPGCDQLIELNLGCFHMTCRCRTEFCYLCRARWKTCSCPQWEERRLLAAAEARVDAQLGIHRAAPARAPAPAPQVIRTVRPAVRHEHVPNPRPLVTPALHDRHATTEDGRRPAGRAVLTEEALGTLFGRLYDNHPADRPAAHPSDQAAPSTTTSHTPLAVHAARPSRSTTNVNSVTNNISSWRTSFTTPASSSQTAALPAAASSSSNATIKPLTIQKKNVARRVTATTREDRDRLVREAVEHLRVNHECNHQMKWGYRSGGGRCENCHHNLPLYLFRCGGCQMLACNRCRRNRL